MKLNKFRMWLLISGLAGVISCKDDEPAPPPESILNVNNQAYDLTSAVFMNWGTTNCSGCADIDVWLLSEGMSAVDSGFVGTGHLVLLDLNSSSTSQLSEGTYTWSLVRNPDTIVNHFVATDCETSCDFSDIGVSGSVTVITSEENYQIDFDITLLNGGRARGTYYGPLEETNPFTIFTSG